MSDPKYREYVKRGEFNPFIHNAWVLMGESQFYQGDFWERWQPSYILPAISRGTRL